MAPGAARRAAQPLLGLQLFALGGLAAAAAGAAPRRLRAPASQPAAAAVFSREDQSGDLQGRGSAELLRFVTAYRTGLEAVADVTPYAALLEGAADADGDLRFFAFIDTWVGNESGWDGLYMDNETGVCSPQRRSYGNGWSLSLDLVLWPPAARAARPRASVVLGSGYFGGKYDAGVVELREGKLQAGGGAASWLELGAPGDVLAGDTPGALAAPPRVIRCGRGKSEAERAALLGYASRSFRNLELQEWESAEEKDAKREDLRSSMLQTLVWPYMRQVEVLKVREEELVVVARYNPGEMYVRPGVPVYMSPGSVLTDTLLEADLWWNLSYPFVPVGEVAEVGNGTMTLKMQHPCLPSNATNQLPGLLVPMSPGVRAQAEALIDGAMAHGNASAEAGADVALEEALLLEPTEGWSRWHEALDAPAGEGARHSKSREDPAELRPSPVLARVEGALDAAPRGNGSAANSTVCVVTQRRQGLLFTRQFDLPALQADDRVLLQLAVTGHGWASTTLSCGEFCHAVYRISLNNVSVANVTQWRDDCKENPIDGSRQRGTWFSPRNGWCPGTVEPGVYFDATRWARAGANDLRFDVVVWSGLAGGYVDYTDFGGFALSDRASFVVGMAAFVYDGDAVGAVRSRGAAETAAERALLEGCSRPEALKPPSEVERRRRLGGEPPEAPGAPQGGPRGGGAFDIEARAPWYLYNETAEGPPGAADGATVVRIFDQGLVQASSRVLHAAVPRSLLTPGWSRAALHLRLSAPPGGLKFDHWDRVGSIGLELTPGGQDAELRFVGSTAQPSSSWRLAAPEADSFI